MKKRIALLLIAVLAFTCVFTALSASAATYTDLVDLLPASKSAIRVAGGVPLYELKDGKLSLTRDGENDIAWPSIAYDLNIDLDLSVTPYLHLSFETSGEGDRGVNGFLYLKDQSGNQVDLQISAMGGNDWDDFRDSADMVIKIDFEKFIKEHIEIKRRNDPTYDVTFDATGKITITGVSLSVYGGMGETIVWNTLALAGDEGAELPEQSEANTSGPEESSTEETTPDESSEESPAEESSAAEESTPAETTSEGTTSEDASSEAPTASTSSDEPSVPSTPATNTGTTATESSEGSSGSNIGLIALIAAICAVVVAAVVIVVVKKKK